MNLERKFEKIRSTATATTAKWLILLAISCERVTSKVLTLQPIYLPTYLRQIIEGLSSRPRRSILTVGEDRIEELDSKTGDMMLECGENTKTVSMTSPTCGREP
jgi:hypothetical protein